MANRKKKKPQSHPSLKREIEVTKTYFDKFSEVARKLLKLFELDPSLFDKFTKKQKLKMMRLKSNPPRVKAQEGHAIPRHYLRKIQQEIYDLIKIYPVNDDRELNLTYMDLLTYGLSFMLYARLQAESEEQTEHKEIYRLIGEKVEQTLDGYDDNIMMIPWQYLRYVMSSISKINIRIYGYEWHWITSDFTYRLGSTITVSAVSPKKIHFIYNEKPRPAYQAICGQFLTVGATPITIPYNQIIPDSDNTYSLEVYVQSHAFTRLKERIDVLPAGIRTICLNSSLIYCQTATLNNGQCVIKLMDKGSGILGYLPFTIIDKKLFVLTFLPVCSQNAPEGKKLHDILGIGRKEIEFLGMDKLSFFMDTDFEAVPRLKNAVIKAGLWHLTEQDPFPDYQPKNNISTSTLTRFFQTERTREEVLSEIEEKY